MNFGVVLLICITIVLGSGLLGGIWELYSGHIEGIPIPIKTFIGVFLGCLVAGYLLLSKTFYQKTYIKKIFFITSVIDILLGLTLFLFLYFGNWSW